MVMFHVLYQNNAYVVLSISFVSMSSRSVNCIYPFEFFHQIHIFCSKDLSRSATTLYGYYVCSCNFGTTRLLHARFLYSAYVLSNHRSKLHSLRSAASSSSSSSPTIFSSHTTPATSSSSSQPTVFFSHTTPVTSSSPANGVNIY